MKSRRDVQDGRVESLRPMTLEELRAIWTRAYEKIKAGERCQTESLTQGRNDG